MLRSGCLPSHGVNTILKKTGFPTGVENMSGALQSLMGEKLESLHGGLKLVLKNTACEGLQSLVKLPAIKKKQALWPLFMDGVQLPQG